MLLIDRRTGSKDLADPLEQMGLPVLRGVDNELPELDYSDVAFLGRGDNDVLVSIGIELKKMTSKSSDLVDSLRSGRLSGHQALGLVGPDKIFDHAWLLIEGEWKVGTRGEILVPVERRFKSTEWVPIRGGMTAGEMEKRVLTLELMSGLRIRHTPTRQRTLHFLANLYRWWNDQTMDRHVSHLTPHTAHGFLPLSDFRQTVMRFPNVGLKASKAVEDYFGANLQDAVNASVADWAEIITVDKQGKPRRLGAKAAQNIINFITGGRA